jgi:hypothetical protein
MFFIERKTEKIITLYEQQVYIEFENCSFTLLERKKTQIQENDKKLG